MRGGGVARGGGAACCWLLPLHAAAAAATAAAAAAPPGVGVGAGAGMGAVATCRSSGRLPSRCRLFQSVSRMRAVQPMSSVMAAVAKWEGATMILKGDGAKINTTPPTILTENYRNKHAPRPDGGAICASYTLIDIQGDIDSRLSSYSMQCHTSLMHATACYRPARWGRAGGYRVPGAGGRAARPRRADGARGPPAGPSRPRCSSEFPTSWQNKRGRPHICGQVPLRVCFGGARAGCSRQGHTATSNKGRAAAP